MAVPTAKTPLFNALLNHIPHSAPPDDNRSERKKEREARRRRQRKHVPLWVVRAIITLTCGMCMLWCFAGMNWLLQEHRHVGKE